MIIQTMLRWVQNAGANDRARAARALAAAYLQSEMGPEDRRAAEAAMHFLTDDPSPKVRLALAETLSRSAGAPRAVVRLLAQDQPSIAAHVIAASPLLGDSDLVDLAAGGNPAIQRLVARRPTVTVSVAAAISEVGSAEAVNDVLDNPGARIAAISLRRIAERFGGEADIRARLLDRDGLPCDVRHQLILEISEALAGFAFVSATIGTERVRRVTREACASATLHLARTASPAELPALVEHLRIGGSMTPGFLIHALCTGNVDFFAAALVSLTGVGPRRVRGILVDGRRQAMRALMRSAGLSASLSDVFVSATLLWRDASRSATVDPAVITGRLIVEFGRRAEADGEIAELLGVVEKLDRAHVKNAARDYALALTRAA